MQGQLVLCRHGLHGTGFNGSYMNRLLDLCLIDWRGNMFCMKTANTMCLGFVRRHIWSCSSRGPTHAEYHLRQYFIWVFLFFFDRAGRIPSDVPLSSQQLGLHSGTTYKFHSGSSRVPASTHSGFIRALAVVLWPHKVSIYFPIDTTSSGSKVYSIHSSKMKSRDHI